MMIHVMARYKIMEVCINWGMRLYLFPPLKFLKSLLLKNRSHFPIFICVYSIRILFQCFFPLLLKLLAQRHQLRDFPGGLVVDSKFPVPSLQGVLVWPLVRELRSHMLCTGQPKKKKKIPIKISTEKCSHILDTGCCLQLHSSCITL